jgi:hypothetical protein
MTWSGDPNWPPGALAGVLDTGDLPTINQALSALFAKLRSSLSLYQRHQLSDRAATIVSLNATWQFLMCFNTVLNEQLHLPLLNLSSALMALNNNNVAPVLSPTPTRRGGRAPDPPDRLALIGIAVGTVGRLRHTKMAAGEARKAVADELAKLGITSARRNQKITCGNHKITPRTIKEWCDRVSAERVGLNSILARGPEAIANADQNEIARFVVVKIADEMTTAKWRSILDGLPRPDARRFILDSLRTSIRTRLAGANRAVGHGVS